ncbi:MAG: serine/threonine-protein kinase [Myxococcota bacterium]
MATDVEERSNDDDPPLAETPTLRPSDDGHATSPPSLDRYVILEQLGAGGMGVVHRAYDPKLRREVAIKMLRFDRRKGSEAERAEHRILREARAMAQLSHPNVLPVYDVEHVSGSVYIAMEYVDGETLSRWIRRHDRTWTEVVEVFRQAGQGLHAAHQAGIIHRDFKPSNVLLGNKGRVLVTDFGLARPHDSADEGEREAPSAWRPVQGHELDSITAAGEVVGTPAYMAPEQLRGEPLDARADQYAYCVALYEGLYRRRPFGHRDPAALLKAKEARKLQPDSAANVPTWLLRLVERGLDPEPEARFETMAELLLQLGRDPVRIRRRWIWAASGAALGAAAIGIKLAAAPDDPCPDPATLEDALWPNPLRTRVRDALLDTGQSYAADTAERVTDRLDTYVQAWTEGHADACRATRVRHEQSAEAFDLRMACLGRHRTELEATVETLTGNVSTSTLQRATGLVAALPAVHQCADVETLRARGRAADPAIAAQIEGLRQTLARAGVLARAGRNEQAESLALGVEQRGSNLHDPVLLGEARLLHGEILTAEGRLPEAERSLRAAFADAVEGRDASLAVKAALQLGTVVGVSQRRTTGGEHWAEQARAWLRGSDTQDLRFAEVWFLEGSVYQVAGRLDEAREAFTRAVTLMRTRPETTDLAKAHHTLGLSLAALGDMAGAEEQFASEIAIQEQLLGARHPEVGQARKSLGGTLYLSGQLPAAVPHLELALSILEDAFGPEHPQVVTALDTLGSLRDDLGDHEDARELFERALAILESSDSSISAMVRLRGNLAQALRHAGEYAAAAEHLREAAALLEAEHGPAHPERVDLLAHLGKILLEAGNLTEAREVLEQADALRGLLPEQSALVSADVARALAQVRRQQARPDAARQLLTEAIEIYQTLGPGLDSRRGEALLDLGTVLLATDTPAAARRPLEAAIPLLTTPQVPAQTLARARFALARTIAAADPPDREGALRLANDARAGLLDDPAARAEIDAWLDALPSP